MTWIIECVQDALVAPADVFGLYADPWTWSERGHNAGSTNVSYSGFGREGL